MLAALALCWAAAGAWAQVAPELVAGVEERTVADATTVFREMLATPGAAIPRSLLSGAYGVAIVPRVLKGGFIVGARFGRGVIVARDPEGRWHAPIFLTLTGGNVGWQAGVQSTDVVLVCRSQRSVESLLSGKLTLGADIAAAAGPVGREAAAATDTGLRAEIYSYSRSRGLFAGVSLDGSVLKVDRSAGASYYRSAGGPAGGAPVVPPSAQQLTALVVAEADPAAGPLAPEPDAVASPPSAASLPAAPLASAMDDASAVREQLAEVAPGLYRLLDPSWQAYLALPGEVFQGTGPPAAEALAASAARFDAVATDPRYASLAARPEFQSVHALVRHYAGLLAGQRPALVLPPPPG